MLATAAFQKVEWQIRSLTAHGSVLSGGLAYDLISPFFHSIEFDTVSQPLRTGRRQSRAGEMCGGRSYHIKGRVIIQKLIASLKTADL